MMAKPALVVIAGATATGKSDTAIEAAKRIGGEIVSADSMQVYRGMDIGTGKVMPQEMQGVPHHLIDVCGPDDAYDLARYAADASEAIRGILERGRIPILCGGTGFYIQAVTKGIAFDEASPSEELREELLEEARTEGNEALHRRLGEVDPVSAAAIHPNNVKRVIRALEYYRLTGSPISEKNAREKTQESPYHVISFLIELPRPELYRRIDLRVDRMMEDGLVEEVRRLAGCGLTKKDVSMQGLGYKEILAYLAGECTLEEAVYILKRDTRHFAKRQLTWFRTDSVSERLDRLSFDDSTEKMGAYIADAVLAKTAETEGK